MMTGTLLFAEPAVDHKRDRALFEPFTKMSAVAIAQRMVEHGRRQAILLNKGFGFLKLARRYDARTSAFKRGLDIQCNKWLILDNED